MFLKCTSKFQVKWNFNGQPLPTNAITTSEGSTLKLVNIKLQNSGEYFCFCEKNYSIYYGMVYVKVVGKI